nr:hypothetical protein [Bacteroides caecigallinarum]
MMLLFAIMGLASTSAVKAQDKVEASVGADLVSGYIWRGQDLGDVSVQPAVGLSYKGFSLSAWGSVGFDATDTKEFDLTLGYEYGGFSIAVTDYWFTSYDSPARYSDYKNAHTFEVGVGYDFGPLAVNWFTNFAGSVGENEKGKDAYASYVSISAPFKLGGIDWSAEIGATPWANDFYNGYSDGFKVSAISLQASKEIKVTDSFSLPLWAQAIWNPTIKGAYFVAGISF